MHIIKFDQSISGNLYTSRVLHHHHLALACNLRPDRRDYRYYRRLLEAD
jgi:hypothetical protein